MNSAAMPLDGAPARPAVLPGLRQDLHLLPGPAHADGAPSWRIHDPVRNRFFEIGWLEFEFLVRWTAGGDPLALCEAVAAETPLHPGEEELEHLVRFLAHHQLLAVDDPEHRRGLEKRWQAARRPWWETALHNYLFFRIPLLRPDAWLTRTVPRMAWFFSPAFLAATLIAGALGAHLALRQADALSSAFSYFFSLQGLVFYGLAATFAKMLHELGHAYTAKRAGLRVPTMGVAFLVLWPVLYTDTGESWKLVASRRRFSIAAAGILSELALAAWTTLAWALTPDGALRSAFFLLATTTWVLTLAINASPFMRFDGYFMLSDALDLPNLHERSSALARAFLRRFFFGIETQDSEPSMGAAKKRGLIAFALATWIYRLTLFLGIAFIVYHLFFKLLGIFLMAIEIGWFILRPVAAEMRELKRLRPLWRWRPKAWGGLLAALFLFLWILPINRQLSAPAVARALTATAVYPASAGQVKAVKVAAGQRVEAGGTLVEMDSPELASRAERAATRAAGLAVELDRTPANFQQRERRLVLEQQLGEALADEAGAREELKRLQIVAPHAGVVRDVPADLVPGRWVGPRQLLLRVVAGEVAEIEAYVDEQMVRALEPGQTVRFYPESPERPVVKGRVVRVDSSAGRAVPPVLASPYGGDIAATVNPKGGVVAHEAVYHIQIRPLEGEPGFDQVARGTVRIDAGWQALSMSWLARGMSVLLRESGF